jgi:NADH-quinone oxidoreductase subunit A
VEEGLRVSYLNDVVFLLGFGFAVIVLPLLILLVFRFLRPTHPERFKEEAYESGMPQASVPRRPFHMAYYTFALTFIVFEIEAVLLFAVAPVLRGAGWSGFFEVFGFVALVTLGLFYAWRKGVLAWR